MSSIVDSIYCTLLQSILQNGVEKKDRTGTGTLSLFGEHLKLDISNQVPLLTTKKVPYKSCILELLWFIKGITNSKWLHDRHVHIWDSNSSQQFLNNNNASHLIEGDCGPNYSFQWNHFGDSYIDSQTTYTQGINQLDYIDNLLKTNPDSRRIFMSAWNPKDIPHTPLPPCHVSVQFYVQNNKLSCHVYQRSCDVFLGLPWNIFSYYVLTCIFAKRHHFELDHLYFSFGDVHIYKNHLTQVHQQLSRIPFDNNTILSLDDFIKNTDLQDIDLQHFTLQNYISHPKIPAPMSI